MIGEETFHPDTRALLGYGRVLAGAGRSPKKGAADHVLRRVFVIEPMADGRLPIRSFGEELVTVFGRDLNHHDLRVLFLEPDRKLLHALIEACIVAGEPGVARVTASGAEGARIDGEMLLTPLKIDDSLGRRFLGLFQPLGGEPFLLGQPLKLLRIGSLHPPLAKEPRSMRLVVDNEAADSGL
jgi:hypothetical protein